MIKMSKMDDIYKVKNILIIPTFLLCFPKSQAQIVGFHFEKVSQNWVLIIWVQIAVKVRQ